MGVRKVILDPMKYFQDKINVEDIIWLNDINPDSDEDLEYVAQELNIEQNSTIKTIPICRCGASKGYDRLNKVCSACNSKVLDPLQIELPRLWCRVPDRINYFMNPDFYNISKNIIYKDLDLWRFISDSRYINNFKGARSPIIVKNTVNGPIYRPGIKEILSIPGFQHSWNWMMDNIDTILKTIMTAPGTGSIGEKAAQILALYYEFEDNIKLKYLPMLPRDTFIVESVGKKKFSAYELGPFTGLVNDFINVNARSNDKPISYIERGVSRFMGDLGGLYKHYIKDHYASKQGIFRKLLYGYRTHFAGRYTITIAKYPNKVDEVGMPWSFMLVVFEPILLNLLVNRLGYKRYNALKLVKGHVKSYHRDIAKAIEIMYEERMFERGIPIIGQRSPALHQGSLPLCWGYPKYDPFDETFTVSDKLVKPQNGDFDGDQYHWKPVFDYITTKGLITLDISFSVPFDKKPCDLGGLFKFVDTLSSIFSQAGHREENNDEDPLPLPGIEPC